MIAYWDTSALLALIFQEPHSLKARIAADETTQIYAWWWLEVEATSALLRRGATQAQNSYLKATLERFLWLRLDREVAPLVNKWNLSHKLRSADAGHLFCFSQARLVLPELTLVSFDAAMVDAARREKFRVWGDPLEGRPG